MSKYLLYLLALIGSCLSVPVHAQVTKGRTVGYGREGVSASQIRLTHYMDSLSMLHDSLYQKSILPSGKSQKMLFPITYDPQVVHKAFGIGQTFSTADSLTLSRYIAHPQDVRATKSQLKSYYDDAQPNGSALPTGNEDQRPLKADPNLVEQMPSQPADPGVIPVDLKVLHPNFWTYKGDYSLQFMQNYISGNWYKGGESNFAALAAVTMEANYNNKQKLKWENKLELKFGLASTRSDSLHSYKTTDDLFRLTSKVGVQATKRWYYTLQLLTYSQFTHSYKSNDPKLYGDFLAPANVNLSIGMDYTVDWLKHKLKGNVHLAPLAYNMKYCRLLELSSRLGIDEGRHVLNDFGSEFTVDVTWQLMEQLSWKSRLYGYTTYDRAELEWENTFVLKFNKFISAQLFFYPRFDDGVQRDGHHGYWQFKEYASIGFNYTF